MSHDTLELQTGAASCGSKPNPGEELVHRHRYLGDGWWVPESLYDAILAQIREVIPVMEPGVHYTLQNLCERQFWDELTIGERRMGGRCVPDMIARGLLPEIEVAEAKRTSRLRYRLR